MYDIRYFFIEPERYFYCSGAVIANGNQNYVGDLVNQIERGTYGDHFEFEASAEVIRFQFVSERRRINDLAYVTQDMRFTWGLLKNHSLSDKFTSTVMWLDPTEERWSDIYPYFEGDIAMPVSTLMKMDEDMSRYPKAALAMKKVKGYIEHRLSAYDADFGNEAFVTGGGRGCFEMTSNVRQKEKNRIFGTSLSTMLLDDPAKYHQMQRIQHDLQVQINSIAGVANVFGTGLRSDDDSVDGSGKAPAKQPERISPTGRTSGRSMRDDLRRIAHQLGITDFS